MRELCHWYDPDSKSDGSLYAGSPSDICYCDRSNSEVGHFIRPMMRTVSKHANKFQFLVTEEGL